MAQQPIRFKLIRRMCTCKYCFANKIPWDERRMTTYVDSNRDMTEQEVGLLMDIIYKGLRSEVVSDEYEDGEDGEVLPL